MSKHLKSDVSFGLIGGLCALMGMSIADLATQVEKSKEANRRYVLAIFKYLICWIWRRANHSIHQPSASARMHASERQDITNLMFLAGKEMIVWSEKNHHQDCTLTKNWYILGQYTVDSRIPMLLIQKDHEHTLVLTNNAYDERFPTANNQLLDVTCHDKMLELLLSPSWVSPLDRKRFLFFAVHVFFRVVDADDGARDITERFHVCTLAFLPKNITWALPFAIWRTTLSDKLL